MRITSLFSYPLKSARGIAVDSARVERRGLAGDRRWMITDAEGRFITQREAPQLAQLSAIPTAGGLRLEHGQRGSIDVAVPEPAAERALVQLWGDRVEAVRADSAASEWLATVLGQRCQLVHFPDDALRPVDADYGTDGDRVAFADGFPLLLCTEESLRDLNARLTTPVPMQRFRPNLVIEGATAFDEDRWQRLRVGEVTMRVVKPCDRCVIVTTDQHTGERGLEPLRTLSRYRRRDGKVLFGQNAIPDRLGTIRVGDEVDLLL